MPINTRESYIVIGTSIGANNVLINELILPAPIDVSSSDEYLTRANRNSVGAMVIQEVGRTQYTTSLKWGRLKSQKWWEINRWFDTHGHVFYMKYFSHTDGKVKIRQFYRGNIEKGKPSQKNTIVNGIAVPLYYTDCGFNVIDMGNNNTRVIQEVNIP